MVRKSILSRKHLNFQILDVPIGIEFHKQAIRTTARQNLKEVVQGLVVLVRRTLLDYMFEETGFVGIDLDHASQIRDSQITLLAVCHHAIRFFDLGYLPAGQDYRGDDVRSCKPNRLLGCEVVDADVLCHPVVNSPNWQDVLVRSHECEELELGPEFAVIALVQVNLSQKAAHFLSSILERNTFGGQDGPIAKQLVHSGVLGHEINGHYWNFAFPNATLRPPANLTLHRNPERIVSLTELRSWRSDLQLFQVSFGHGRR